MAKNKLARNYVAKNFLSLKVMIVMDIYMYISTSLGNKLLFSVS